MSCLTLSKCVLFSWVMGASWLPVCYPLLPQLYDQLTCCIRLKAGTKLPSQSALVCHGESWWISEWGDFPFRRRDPVKSFKVKPVWCKYEDLEFGTDVPTSCSIYQFGPSWDDKHTSAHSFAESGFSGHSALLYHGGTGAGRCWWANEPGKIGNSKRSHWE